MVLHTDEDLSLGVDSMLTDMDQNNDGYIDWYEYSSFTMKDNAPVENEESDQWKFCHLKKRPST